MPVPVPVAWSGKPEPLEEGLKGKARVEGFEAPVGTFDPNLSSQPQAKRPRRSDYALKTTPSDTTSPPSNTTITSSNNSSSTDTSASNESPGYSRTIFDIAKAGCLLSQPPLPAYFDDEEEMRRVYSLIYDVFRYKSVLNQALIDTAFFFHYPQYQKSANLVWLLFYDLYKRRFLPRDEEQEVKRKELFGSAGLICIDAQLWELRVRLAAAVARLRIKHNALKLTQLLPPHLRDEHVIALDDAFVTAWLNTFKIKQEEMRQVIEKFGLTPMPDAQENLEKDNYKFDHLCPKFIMCHPSQRSGLAQSVLVRKHQIVMQDRAFCLGAAVMCRAVLELELTGSVAQTHINSPRTTGYLATVLADNPKIDGLIAFGAGDRKEEYEAYLLELGVNNTQVLAERFVDMSADCELLSGVSAVLATPPNTYSGVLDPVDLVCSRGGDLSMLEVLTETEMGAGSRERVNVILEEQRQTLRLAMSRPQIQVVLYETHSIVAAENRDMVTRLVNEMNQNAHDRHVEELHKMSALMPQSSSSNPHSAKREVDHSVPPAAPPVVLPPARVQAQGNEKVDEDKVKKEFNEGTEENKEKEDNEDKGESVNKEETEVVKESVEIFSDVDIPPCDLFEIGRLPNLCPNGDTCLSLEEEGCYLALLRRKEIVRLDAKYMITVAESRGLFGGDVKKTTSGRSHKRKEMLSNRSGSGGSMVQKQRGRRCKVEVDRIAAPTHASLMRRASVARSGPADACDDLLPVCPRHHTHTQDSHKVADARRWWGETARHIAAMDRQLRLKISSPDDVTPIPMLRLTRTPLTVGSHSRVPFPLHVSLIEFQHPTHSIRSAHCSLV